MSFDNPEQPREATVSERRVRAEETFVWRRVGHEILVLPVDSPDDEHLIAITGTASALWELLAEPVSLTDAISALSELYGVDPGEIDGDVRRIVADLEARGIVRKESADDTR